MTQILRSVGSGLGRSAESRARRRVLRELADYASPADRAELEAMLERSGDPAAREYAAALRLVG